MAGTLWSVTATKSAGKLTRGMTVEILVVGTTARPSAKQIIEAIESKYKSNMQRRPWEKSQAFFFIEASIKALSQQRPQITAAR